MKRLLPLLFLLLTSVLWSAPAIPSNAEISLLTCSKGSDLYSIFGHSAIRVRYNINGFRVDSVYNYGTFNFNQPGFYVKFARGKLDYSLSRQVFHKFQYEYVHYGRGMEEQVLALDSVQKQALYQALSTNYRAENRNYRYDFFFDNCATRIANILKEAAPEVMYQDSFPQRTFRQMIDVPLENMPWSDFGIDIALGMPCDRFLEDGEQMFLPEYLMQVFGRSQVGSRALVEKTETLLTDEERQSEDLPISPWQAAFLYLALSVILVVLGWRRKWAAQLVLKFHFVVVGLVGLLVAFLWWFTDHTITADNLNILWAWPTHLLFLGSRFSHKGGRMYLWAFLAVQLVLLMAWSFWPQDLHEAIIPLVVAHMLSAMLFLRKASRQ